MVFSGDITDAPAEKGGATEAFWFGENIKDDMGAIDLNNYTASWYESGKESQVPFKLIIGNADSDQFSRDYLLICHKAALNVQNTIEGVEEFLGFLESDIDGKKTFWFAKSRMGDSIVSRYNEHKEAAVEATRTSFRSCLKLRDILERAGAVFEKGEQDDWDIDLSLDKVTKDTFITMFKKNN